MNNQLLHPNSEFPSAIKTVLVREIQVMLLDGEVITATMGAPEDFLNEVVTVGRYILIFTRNGQFYDGGFESCEDIDGKIVVNIRSLANPSVTIAIPFDEISGLQYILHT